MQVILSGTKCCFAIPIHLLRDRALALHCQTNTMDPLAIAKIAFQVTCVAVKTFRNGLNFTKDAERLVLGLEVERFRLHVWGENAGLAPSDGQPATLPSRLLPICEIIKDYLKQIEQLVRDADGLSSRYGLLQTEEPPTKSELVRKLVDRMQRSIHKSGVKLGSGGEDDKDGGQGDEDEADAALGLKDLSLQGKKTTTKWKKIRWAVRDLDGFDNLIKDLAHRVNKLNDLLTETQQRKTREDNYRVNMVVVGSAVDKASLELIRAAMRGESDTLQVRTAIERKALFVTDPEHGSIGLAGSSTSSKHLRPVRTMAPPPLSLDDFVLPTGFAEMKRFLTVKRSSAAQGPYYLLERKTFDANILPQDMARLTSRVQRLVLLLQKPKSPEFQTPHAEGCIKDTTRFCWWIVFRFPLHTMPQREVSRRLPSKNKWAPVSLVSLLELAKFRPPLEQRLALASALCTTFSELYLSGWLHKGVRSENILFPTAGAILQLPPYAYKPEEMRVILSSPLVCGFDYSRHESEWATIDKARMSEDVGVTIYRHPNYQGEAAEGYKVQYDIYSVGLILVEIALWKPLISFLEAKKSSSSSSSPAPSSSAVQMGVPSKPTSVSLSADMASFHKPHALELKKRVVGRVDSELAFRVGSPFCQAVTFCLKFADEQPDTGAGDGGEVGVHPAMEFYNNVVVPLAAFSTPR
ncbi:prion-inhibition and propagation domain-containing protein [Trichoderma aethiopicum]